MIGRASWEREGPPTACFVFFCSRRPPVVVLWLQMQNIQQKTGARNRKLQNCIWFRGTGTTKRNAKTNKVFRVSAAGCTIAVKVSVLSLRLFCADPCQRSTFSTRETGRRGGEGQQSRRRREESRCACFPSCVPVSGLRVHFLPTH